ncbi:MAG: hypothetical protein ACXW32_08380 [Limisphaerales bacterium]
MELGIFAESESFFDFGVCIAIRFGAWTFIADAEIKPIVFLGGECQESFF